MNCYQKIEHVIRRGDTLYELAKYYKTSLPELFAHNPGINPYNLQVGSTVIVCPGEDFAERERGGEELREKLRIVWMQHAYWTRALLVSIAERLRDEKDVENRLLKNPQDIADIFARYYSPEVASMIGEMLTEHLQIGGALITALRDNDMDEANALNDQWYINADKIAALFAQINPYYDEGQLREMLYQHLNLLKEEVSARLQGNYPKDMEAFARMEEEAMSMADEFARGIMEEFPQLLMEE